jgi:hypothetical protein
MLNEKDPIIDNWYFHKDKGQRFMVVNVNEEDKLIDIQHFDGDIEEITFSDWHKMNIEIGAEPLNWSGPTDVGEVDDYGTEVTDTKPEEWDKPLEELRPPGLKD